MLSMDLDSFSNCVIALLFFACSSGVIEVRCANQASQNPKIINKISCFFLKTYYRNNTQIKIIEVLKIET